MSTAANVRAGRAYVEVATDDAKLRKGLQDMSTRIETWSRNVTAIGLKAMAAASTIALPIGLSMRTFADFESQMSKVAAITKATADEVRKLRDQAKMLGKTTFFQLRRSQRRRSFSAWRVST